MSTTPPVPATLWTLPAPADPQRPLAASGASHDPSGPCPRHRAPTALRSCLGTATTDPRASAGVPERIRRVLTAFDHRSAVVILESGVVILEVDHGGLEGADPPPASPGPNPVSVRHGRRFGPPVTVAVGCPHLEELPDLDELVGHSPITGSSGSDVDGSGLVQARPAAGAAGPGCCESSGSRRGMCTDTVSLSICVVSSEDGVAVPMIGVDAGHELVVLDLGCRGLDDRAAVAAAAHVAPGGTLAVLTHSHRIRGRLLDPTGTVIAAVQNADLLYLQHIVIVEHHLRPHSPTPADPTDDPAGCGGEAPRRGAAPGRGLVDLTVFARPGPARTTSDPTSENGATA